MSIDLDFAKKRDHVINELLTIGGRVKGDEIIINCAWHNDSRPSLQVHIGNKIKVGGFHCWSCGEHGGFNKIASAYKLKPLDEGTPKPVVITEGKMPEPDDPFKLLLSTPEYSNFYDTHSHDTKVLKGTEPLPEGFKWRGFGRRFYESLGGKFYWDRKHDSDYLYFPLNINGEYKGYTTCSLTEGAKLKYMTFADTKKVFFGYDMLAEGDPIVLVEGHFDFLRLLAHGIPAICIFGTENWGPVKKGLLTAKNPSKVLILMDGDDAGYKAALEIFYDLRTGFDVDILWLPKLPKPNSIDPGNMSIEWIEETRRRLYE